MKKSYMIGNTHFDPVWLWKWDEAMSSITATFRSALDRMKEYPEFKYSFATPPVFEWIKNTNPELFEEIKERVREGRWELAEGWWLQPDCYTPQGESLVRQGLYGQRYLKENFGKYSEIVFNIDSFGHPSTLPQILSKSGIKYYVFCRPERRHVELEAPLFYWKSKDGSRVLTYRDDLPYQADTGEAMDNAKNEDYDTLIVYGVTDHGGAPTKKSIEEIREREDAVCSTVEDFFKGRTTDYEIQDEFITGDFGVYANNPEIKSLNRIAEYLVLNAEKASVIAKKYNSTAIRNCWQDILFNQFHDILGGACIKEAYFDAKNVYGRAIATANEIMHFNLLSVTNKINLPGKNPDNVWNIVVWNLNAEKYNGYIEAEVQWVHEFPWYDKGIALEDAEGNRYECQIIRERSVIPAFRSRFLFKAEIPSMGYKAFKLIKTNEDVIKEKQSDFKVVETDKYRISLSDNGFISEVYDKALERILATNLLYPVCFKDDGDTWAFNIDGCIEECEPFQLEKIESVEKKGFRTVLKLTYLFRSSKLELYYSFYKDSSYMDVRYRVNWNEKHMMLKLISDVESADIIVSTPYGSVLRGETKAEVPVGEWIEADNLVFSFKNIFAYNMIDKKLGLTILRSPIYGDLRLSEIDLDEDYDILSQGITEGEIRVSFEKVPSPTVFSQLFNNPPIVLCEANHTGEIKPEGSYLSLNGEGVSLTVMKKCEDSDGIILRGAEENGNETEVTIRLEGIEHTLLVKPYEIFTVKAENGILTRVNMLEEDE